MCVLLEPSSWIKALQEHWACKDCLINKRNLCQTPCLHCSLWSELGRIFSSPGGAFRSIFRWFGQNPEEKYKSFASQPARVFFNEVIMFLWQLNLCFHHWKLHCWFVVSQDNECHFIPINTVTPSQAVARLLSVPPSQEQFLPRIPSIPALCHWEGTAPCSVTKRHCQKLHSWFHCSMGADNPNLLCCSWPDKVSREGVRM